MITERELLTAIDECQQEPITSTKRGTLADLFIIYDHLFGEPMDYRSGYSGDARTPENLIKTNGGSEFLQIVNGRNPIIAHEYLGDNVEVLREEFPTIYQRAIELGILKEEA